MEFAIWITAAATAAIAVYAYKTHQLSSKIRARDDEFREQLIDLYRAIVISNIFSSDSGIERRVDLFKINYKGKKIPIDLKL